MTKLSKEDSIELVKQMRLKPLNKNAENTLSKGRKILASINTGNYKPTDTVTITKAEYDALVADAERLFYIATNCELIEAKSTKGKEQENLQRLRQAIDSAKGK